MFNILFICMGNICRSPSAEGFFRHHLAQSRWHDQVTADSAGTHSYHTGHPPDLRAIQVAKTFGVDISALRARTVQAGDFARFDLIVPMDHVNLKSLQDIASGLTGEQRKARVRLMMAYSQKYPDVSEVPDPYYGTERDFHYMCTLLDEATRELLHYVGRQIEGRQGGG